MGCFNSTIVDAPIDKVWDTIKNFHDMKWAAGVVETLEEVGSTPGNTVGAKRILNNAFHETLVEVDEKRFFFKYSIDDGPGPVAKTAVKNYFGEVQLLGVTDTNQTFFQWTSSFDSDDAKAVEELCNPIYQALLAKAKETIKK